jgi:preprotein translocase subunit SecB
MNTEKATSASQESDGRYEQFLRGLSLIWVGLRGCSSSLDRAGLFKLFLEKKSPARTFEGTYNVTEVGTAHFEGSGSFIVTIRETLNADPVLSVECVFEAHFHGTKPLPQEFVERFVNSEFQLILVPYARQFVSSITAQMSIPPLVLPLSTGSFKGRVPKKVGTRRGTKPHAKAR